MTGRAGDSADGNGWAEMRGPGGEQADVEGNIKESSRDDVNPFKIPQHNDLFQMKNKEKTQKKLEQQRKLALLVHEKVTFTDRMRARQSRLIEEVKEEENNIAHSHARKQRQNKPAQRIYSIKDPYIDRGSMNEYITKKRELFLMEYSLAVKREEIQLLEQVAAEEERKLTCAERFLEDNTVLFEDFLKENDLNSVEAMKIAEQETKVKLEKTAEIKKITSKIVALKSDILKYEDILMEYRKYEEFLRILSNPEQSKSRCSADIPAATDAKNDGKQAEKTKKNGERKTSDHSDTRARKCRDDRKLSSSSKARVPSTHKSSHQSNKIPAAESDSFDNKKDPELFFRDPQELLRLMTELEEQTLSLIQNTRETEESLEEFRQTAELTQRNIEFESRQLEEQIKVINESIQRERERTVELEQRCRLFGFGKHKTEEQEKTLVKLSEKVEEVYHCCVGETAAHLSILQMLTAIEGKLVELLENADMIPREHISIAERAKENERRIRLREEKIHLQVIHQEERQKKSLERSKTEIKKPARKYNRF